MIVRETNWAGPCMERGVVIHETKNFYVIEPMGHERRRRIKKGICIHTEPCNRCCDHPQTDYPRGYEG